MKYKKAYYLLFPVLFLLTVGSLSHAALVAIGPLDELINREDSVVVVAKMKSLSKKQKRYVDRFRKFKIKIIRVVKGNPKNVPRSLSVFTHVWPYDLELPLESGAQAFFVLRKTQEKGYIIEPHKRAIIPVVTKNLPEKITQENLFAVMVDNLLLSLSSAEFQFTKAQILRLIADICPEEKLNIFVPYLKSKDIWVRRAALGALIKLSPKPRYLEAAKKDFADFLGSAVKYIETPYGGKTPATRLFFDMYQDVKWAARYPVLNRCKTYLPLYRIVVDNCQEQNVRESIGLRGLTRVGTKEDLLRIYSFHNNKNPYGRQEALMTISKILNLKLRGLVYNQFLEKEAEQQKIVHDALIKEGLIEK